MLYESTRGFEKPLSAEEAIVKGLASNGGLFVPNRLPTLSHMDFEQLAAMDYQGQAAFVLGKFLPSFSPAEIQHCVQGAYPIKNFDTPEIAPIVPLKERTYIHELWHGPTCAFKDMALQLLPYLLTVSAKKIGEHREIVILVATSGDTGKAALEGFCNVSGTRVVVYFPENGVSQVQKQQMVTQQGENLKVIAVQGNFDDAQTGVKEIFADAALAEILDKKGLVLSSANSINWGRLLPQIVYYISACVTLMTEQKLKMHEKVNIVVPTGNFGNIAAAYYAKIMGAPIGKLICASNENHVLTDFIHTGTYDKKRIFHKTTSPSMDILISSNLERLLYELSGHDGAKISAYMQALREQGSYTLDEPLKTQIADLFFAAYADDEETRAMISKTWKNEGYLADTHTAVALCAYEKYVAQSGDTAVTLIESTANPFKFAKDVASAIDQGGDFSYDNEFALLESLAEKIQRKIPVGLAQLDKKEVVHFTVCAKEHMKKTLLTYLDVQ